MKLLFDVELSEKESFLVGRIVALWGALEFEIFEQTVFSFPEDVAELPKEMNNMQFSKVLELWKERVIAKTKGRRQKVLMKQHARICQCQDYRDAIIHGMWDWNRSNPTVITTVRVKKKEIVSMKFEPDDLAQFCTELQEINYKIRYPGGVNDQAKAFAKSGSGMSRQFMAMFGGFAGADELLPREIREALRSAEAAKK